jgi:hypothetical protein
VSRARSGLWAASVHLRWRLMRSLAWGNQAIHCNEPRPEPSASKHTCQAVCRAEKSAINQVCSVQHVDKRFIGIMHLGCARETQVQEVC